MPLKSYRVTANLPGEIQELIEIRIREGRYKSLSDYVTSCVLDNLATREPAALMNPIMREPQWIRDAIIRELVDDFHGDAAKPAGWVERRIMDLVVRHRQEPAPPLGQT